MATACPPGNRATDVGAGRVSSLVRRFGPAFSAPTILFLSASAIPAGQVTQSKADLSGQTGLASFDTSLAQPFPSGPVLPGETPEAEEPVANFAAQPFLVAAGDSVSLGRALDCMTQAIYYEAATEPTDGQRAVAQVVLNRVRHPAFPKSVCGVVYQGWHLPTGCQFTFTCDGSLARKPSTAEWTRARRVAEDALSGQVYPDAGLATHYHASYVDPYWSSSLSKVGSIGSHIFYRWKGTAGSAQAFVARYSGIEVIPDVTAPSKPQVSSPGTELALGNTQNSTLQFSPRVLGVIEDESVGSKAASLADSGTVPLSAPAAFKPRPLSISEKAPAAAAASTCAAGSGADNCSPSPLPTTGAD